MTREQRVVRAVRRREVSVRFVGRHDWEGMYDFFGGIDISIYAKEPVSVLVHEVLHHLYPKKSEEWILKHEAIVYSRLSPKDWKYLNGVVKRALAKYKAMR